MSRSGSVTFSLKSLLFLVEVSRLGCLLGGIDTVRVTGLSQNLVILARLLGWTLLSGTVSETKTLWCIGLFDTSLTVCWNDCLLAIRHQVASWNDRVLSLRRCIFHHWLLKGPRYAVRKNYAYVVCQALLVWCESSSSSVVCPWLLLGSHSSCHCQWYL